MTALVCERRSARDCNPIVLATVALALVGLAWWRGGPGPPMTVYISEEGHFCHDKSIDLLGLGKKHLRKIPVNDDFTINDAIIDTLTSKKLKR